MLHTPKENLRENMVKGITIKRHLHVHYDKNTHEELCN